PRRRAAAARAPRFGSGADRGAALFRRTDHRRDGGDRRRIAGDDQTPVGAGARLAQANARRGAVRTGTGVNPDRWARLNHLFRDALDRPAPERRDWLAGACPDDEELRDEVASLL